MALAPGTRVGPYEVLAPLGAGGMGDVYRALDPRLGREVALKVLPSEVARDVDRLRRFEVEARAAGALNHPALLAVFDVGEDGGVRYVVSELLDGETLRERLGASGFPPRKAIDYAIQVAHGLAAAHEKGIIHRDLKPENLFVTRDGRAKILDFGLAKLVEPPASGGDPGTRMRDATATGMVLGTAGYMAPEQVRGLPADDRSDIFAFGCVLYEILGRRRAFPGDTAAEAMTAVLREDPPSLEAIDATLPAAVDRVVKRCLEKRPEERFQSARDVAFALEALSTEPARAPAVSAIVRRPRRSLLVGLALAAAIAAVAALGFAYGKDRWAAEMPDYTQLTFRRGTIRSARFAPDGQTIVYGAEWEGKPPELFSTRPDGRESRPLGITNATVLSISASEMAIGVEPQFQSFFPVGGSLARVPLGGGAPRVVLDDVAGADWSPDGTQLAVVRQVEGRWRIEFPIGTVLYETDAFLAYPAVSPAADAVAFLEFSARDPGVSAIAIVDRSGRKRLISGEPVVMGRPFWHRESGDLWFRTMGEAEGNHGGSTSVYETTPAGRKHLITRLPGDIHIEDMAADGRLLAHRSTSVGSMFAQAGKGGAEVDLSWLDASTLADVSADGRLLVFTETMAGGRPSYGVYIRRTDGSPAVRLGDGRAYALSPDGKWVLAMMRGGQPRIVLLPTGAGSARTIANLVVTDFRGGTFFPDSRRFVYAGNVPGAGSRLFVTDTDGSAPRAIGPAGLDVEFPVVSPDGRMVAAANAMGEVFVIPLDGGPMLSVSAAEPGELPIQWTADSRSLYVYRPDEIPARVYQVPVTGTARRLFREIAVADPTGLDGRMTVVMTPDGSAYAYSFLRRFSELYLVTGLR